MKIRINLKSIWQLIKKPLLSLLKKELEKAQEDTSKPAEPTPIDKPVEKP